MHKMRRLSNHNTGVRTMRKKQETPAVHELRDRPVPPVKGAVTDCQDAVLRPEGAMAPGTAARLEDTAVFDGWL